MSDRSRPRAPAGSSCRASRCSCCSRAAPTPVCLLDVAIELGAGVAALHVNYGLREERGDDEEFCRGSATGSASR